MMIRPLPLTGLLIALLLPTSALAYVTPEEALDDSNYSTRFYAPPPSKRSLQDIVAEQQRISAERREAELNAVKPQPESAMEEELHEAAGEESPSSSPSAPARNTGLDPATERLLLRIQAQKDAAERQNFIESLLGGNGETLRSGAPLADTGPATALITLAIAGAIGETWRRVRKADAKTRL